MLLGQGPEQEADWPAWRSNSAPNRGVCQQASAARRLLNGHASRCRLRLVPCQRAARNEDSRRNSRMRATTTANHRPPGPAWQALKPRSSPTWLSSRSSSQTADDFEQEFTLRSGARNYKQFSHSQRTIHVRIHVLPRWVAQSSHVEGSNVERDPPLKFSCL
jgi:hypothetical protein